MQLVAKRGNPQLTLNFFLFFSSSPSLVAILLLFSLHDLYHAGTVVNFSQLNAISPPK